MCCSLWFCLLFLMGISDVLATCDITHKIMELHHKEKTLEDGGAKNYPIFQLCPNMQFFPATHFILQMGNFTFQADK